MNQSYQGKITTSIKYVVIAMSMMVAVSTSQADISQKKIGDLEIYKAATDGQINLMMMLDTSGSMGISSPSNLTPKLATGPSFIVRP